MQVQVAFDRILNLVAGVDVEFAAIFAATRNECHGVGRQPQLLRALARLGQIPHDAFKIHIGHLKRGNIEQHGGSPASLRTAFAEG